MVANKRAPRMNLYLLGAMTLAMIMLPPPSHAGSKHSRLNERNITSFITETTKISKGGAGISVKAITEYLEKHLHKHSRFKSTMRYKIPGYPTQETTLSFSKEEFIENVQEGAKSVSEYDNSVDILDIKISQDKTKATVTTRSTESVTIPVPGAGPNGETGEVPIEGHSDCTQILSLNKKGIIQMYNATCVTNIEFVQEY